MAYMDFGFKKFTSIHDWLATEMNKSIQKTEISEWVTKGKTTNPKRLPQRNCPTQLENHDVPTDDVENTNGKN